MCRARTLDGLDELRAPGASAASRPARWRPGRRSSFETLSPVYSHMVTDAGAAGRLPRQRRGARPALRADDEGEPPPTISTDMANVSLALPDHPPDASASSPAGRSTTSPSSPQPASPRRPTRAIVDGALAMAWTALDAAATEPLRDRLLGPAPAGPAATSARLVDAELGPQHVGTSPRVAMRRSASFIGTRRFCGAPGRRRRRRSSAASTAAWSRSARTRVVRSIWDRWSSMSIGKTSVGSRSLLDEPVHADDDLLAVVDRLGVVVGGLLDLVLHEAGPRSPPPRRPCASMRSRYSSARRSTSSVSHSTK